MQVSKYEFEVDREGRKYDKTDADILTFRVSRGSDDTDKRKYEARRTSQRSVHSGSLRCGCRLER